MTTFDTGRKAEAVAADFLRQKGYKIAAQNWRLRSCEIDIVAIKNSTAYCVEVKYRQNNSQGAGAEYVTPPKLRQMQFAAEKWAHETGWDGDFQLAVVEVSGGMFEVTDFLDDIIL